MLSMLYRMFLLHIQAQIVPSRKLLWQTRVQYSLWDVSLIIQAGIVPRGTTPTNTCPVLSLGDVSHTHPGYNGAHRELLPQTHAKYALYWTFPVHIQAEMVPTGISSHKSIPSTLYGMSLLHIHMPHTLSMQNFSYTSRLKWCLQGPPPANQCSVHSEWDFSLTHPGWNGTYGELLPQTHTQYAPMGSISKHIQAQMTSRGNSSHELKLR